MSGFRDLNAAHEIAERISDATMRDASDFVLSATEATSHPDQALVNLERWLNATGNASTYYDSMAAVPELARLLTGLLGASHQLADVLVQNPEMADFVLDPAEIQSAPDSVTLTNHASRLLAESTSFSHSLDRLRFLKQSWQLRIAAADLGSLWPEEKVWKALSDVADVLLIKAREVVWQHVSEGETNCPVSVVAMGKLGGQELNFSSDIDLIYVLEDGVSDEIEKLAIRFCEALNRALSDRMGRGSLYRVDLRLRPYGTRGSLVPSIKAVEAYYERYAEPWEHVALIRSRMVAGDAKIADRWEKVREKMSFQKSRGEWVIEDLLKMRARLEESSEESDLKRGSGGIRDVEFLTQILQLLFGNEHENVQVRATCDALRELQKINALEKKAVTELVDAYTFLRQVEHRAQLLGDRQTHELPNKWEDRAYLGRRMGYSNLQSFDAAMKMQRTRVRGWYDEKLRTAERVSDTPRESVLQKLGTDAPLVASWMDGITQSSWFYESLNENQTSLSRVRAIVQSAPAMVPHLRELVSVTEQIISGEIYEPFDPGERFASTTNHWDAQKFAESVRRGWLRIVARWAMAQDFDFGERVSELMDAALAAMKRIHGCEFQVVALGSFGAREMSLFSDQDVVFIRSETSDGDECEKQAQRLLAAAQELRSANAPIDLDLRLRPDGRIGRLVITEDTVMKYEQNSLQAWERIAFGRARSMDALELPAVFHRVAYGKSLDKEILSELLLMKKRIETERVNFKHRKRQIKLGEGGQDDILWLVQLLWWKNVDSVSESTPPRVVMRLKELVNHGVINTVEHIQIKESWRFFGTLRLHLGLLGFNDEILPENPDKLSSLSEVMDLGGANDVLAVFERHRNAVRGIYEGVVTRLGA